MVVVVSPHLDDAVLSCGQLLAKHPGSLVLTVFAGWPRRPTLGSWDRDCGFHEGDDVIGARRAEDIAACRQLAAVTRWLDFVDDQYGEPSSVAKIAATLDMEVAATKPDAVFIPLGLFHHDHERVHIACRRLVGSFPNRVYAYEDALYRNIDDAVDHRIAELRVLGLHPHRAHPSVEPQCRVKQRAISCYRSQVRALTSRDPHRLEDAVAPERYWKLGR
jgi:LmbE family N-acetylglucosaminyl deacetylase